MRQTQLAKLLEPPPKEGAAFFFAYAILHARLGQCLSKPGRNANSCLSHVSSGLLVLAPFAPAITDHPGQADAKKRHAGRFRRLGQERVTA